MAAKILFSSGCLLGWRGRLYSLRRVAVIEIATNRRALYSGDGVHVFIVKASGNHCAARWMARRPRHRGRGRADLPDHLVSVPRHRACRQSVRAQGTGQHLHPHHESDERRAGEARRGAGRRRRRLGAGIGAGGLGVCPAEPRARRRQRGQLDRPLWRHLEFVRQHAQGSRHRSPFRRSGRSEQFPPRDRRSYPRLLCRDPAQSKADGISHRRSRRHRHAISAFRWSWTIPPRRSWCGRSITAPR